MPFKTNWVQEERLFHATMGELPLQPGQCFTVKLMPELPFKKLYLYGATSTDPATNDFRIVADLNFYAIERTKHGVRTAPDEILSTLKFVMGDYQVNSPTAKSVVSHATFFQEAADAIPGPDSRKVFFRSSNFTGSDASAILNPQRIHTDAAELEYALVVANAAGVPPMTTFYAFVGLQESSMPI